MKYVATLFVLLSLVLIVAGCGDEAEVAAPAAPAAAAAAAGEGAPAASIPPGLIVTEVPAGAQNVSAVKQTVKDGDAVVVRGKIGGGEAPMAKNRAMMTILDATVQTCDTMPGDACATPWDACCETPDKIAANSATVQVVDESGKPLAGSLENVGGLKPLKEVTVAGIARRPAGSDALIVDAQQIHVTP